MAAARQEMMAAHDAITEIHSSSPSIVLPAVARATERITSPRLIYAPLLLFAQCLVALDGKQCGSGKSHAGQYYIAASTMLMMTETTGYWFPHRPPCQRSKDRLAQDAARRPQHARYATRRQPLPSTLCLRHCTKNLGDCRLHRADDPYIDVFHIDDELPQAAETSRRASLRVQQERDAVVKRPDAGDVEHDGDCGVVKGANEYVALSTTTTIEVACTRLAPWPPSNHSFSSRPRSPSNL
ncbi:hypothetical protein GGX14DRAFT_596936 [Mycena pura]|uniref:Uncharacterized protein n=1 Tax=Mycena pura TaxID=153505 RepID=A0AAD6UP64_9AGAR|nr:hypothetical protein GGX14DRAFT_596936 [Mycena pura]